LHEKAVTQVKRIIAERHHYDPDDKEALWVWDTLQGAKFTERIFSVMTLFFGAVALLTLALGGIGVMNIMLIAVKERTREIGVRKALGATTGNIQRQFFLEGFFLTMMSGGAGMLLAVGLCQLVNLAPMPARFAGMIISWQTAMVSLLMLVAIGVVTSTYPARRAAELPPVEALRFEM
jgi:putative ABC transport system permease protein